MAKSEMRFCKDIGMFAVDRPRTSCKWATAFCRANCYNAKLEKLFNLKPKDARNEIFWEQLDGEQIKLSLSTKRNQTRRFRLMTRGEAFSTEGDVFKVAKILNANKQTLFWIPTRAWRDESMRELLVLYIMPLKNARLQASLDPTNSTEEINSLVADGWSTMFFGDDSDTEGRFLCAKTHKGKKGHCAICRGGCFSNKQTHVHLKQH